MKALTIWQPWASLVALGAKTIETRSWSTSYRGPLLICAAKKPPSQTRWPGPDPVVGSAATGWQIGDAIGGPGLINGRPLPLGAAVALVDLVDVVPIITADIAEEMDHADLPFPRIETDLGGTDFPDGWLELYHSTLGSSEPETYGRSIPMQAPYGDFTPGRYGWLLDNVRPLPEPIPVRGRQRLWSPPDDVVAAVEGAVPA